MKLPLKILDLFAGPGGLSLGFEFVKSNGKNAFELYKAIEIDNYACKTLATNFGKEKVIQGDLQNLEFKRKIVDLCKNKHETYVDLIIAGIPCQSFSLIGPRSGNNQKHKSDYRDTLYMDFYFFVKKLMPKIFLIENVKGILSKKNENGDKTIGNIVDIFEKLGYRMDNELTKEKYMLLNAVYYGIPQRRERVFIIGVRNDLLNKPIPYPVETHYYPKRDTQTKFTNKANIEILNRFISLKEAIGDLPKVKAKFTLTDIPDDKKKEIIKQNINIDKKNLCGLPEIKITKLDRENYRSFLKTIDESKSALYFQKFVRDSNFIKDHISRSQQLSDIELFNLMPEGWTSKDIFHIKSNENEKIKKLKFKLQKLIKYDCKGSFTDKYRKQNWDEPSTTIFAHLQKDGNRFIHPKQPRTFTPREAARIQSFPDSFTFAGPMTQKFKQIGNAVPPLLAKAIAESLLNILIS